MAIVGIFLAIAIPGLVGADESFVVQSSSMSPSIGAGSVVFVSDQPATDVTEGDVITFETTGEQSSRRVTHRVVDVVEQDGDRAFRTKGDANEEPDTELVSPDQILGIVQFHLPLIGYVVAFGGSQYGVIALIVVPAILLIVTELRDLIRTSRTDGGGRENKPD
ncbi:signal peptidase I [Halorhabdus amylolytica]|uniref:signal peptidase I n=1 Tax=Halorhabdus amylolytica TaxID=2559573 RepID=UPI00200B21DE|nr:signal peptidase I [Halorhabdus amylolytica]